MRSPRVRMPPWLTVALLRTLATVVALAAGFSAISDDDFARLVIAQGFARAPSLDPSGTSWLPFPFWLLGSVMRVFGTSVEVARQLAFVTSVGAAVLVHVAARWAGLGRTPALLGAGLAALVPHAVWLGAATVPEGYSAALCLLAAASTCSRELGRRWLGTLAVGAATLSRYEAWPVAAYLFGAGLFDAFVQQDRRLLAPAACALLGPLGWLVHGAVDHGEPLFFLDRVADYRRALGRSPVDSFSALLGYPKVLLRAEPELTLAVVASLLLGARRDLPRHWQRLALACGAMLAFLVIGDLGDGAPTHHPERPLLLVWLVAALFLGHALVCFARRRRALALVLGAALVGLLLRPVVTRRDGFIDRSAELSFGRSVRALVGDAPVLVDTPDFAYFAVMAGFEAVDRIHPLRDHDPRTQEPDPWSSPAALREVLSQRKAPFLIVSNDRREALADLAEPLAETDRYTLYRLTAEPP